MRHGEGLSPQQIQFCEIYVETGVMRQAAVQAGYAAKCAHSTANRLIKTPAIIHYISELKRQGLDAIQLNANKIARELYVLARDARKEKNYAVAHRCYQTLLEWTTGQQVSDRALSEKEAARGNDDQAMSKEASHKVAALKSNIRGIAA